MFLVKGSMASVGTGEDHEVTRLAAKANRAMFDREGEAKGVEGSPHLTHARIRDLYASLVVRVFQIARQHTDTPRVLDLGAGEGSATLFFLELGAHVTAVDISESQLASLAKKCGRFKDRLQIHHEAISETFRRNDEGYDVIVMNSFLHHVPDYLGMIRHAVSLLRTPGQFFSFQDPLRYDTLSRSAHAFSQGAYFAWRLFQGNYLRGLKTRIRRIRRVYIPGSEEDDAEYHVTRNGVDQHAITNLLTSEGFWSEIIPYFSTQSGALQAIGAALGIKNTFAIIAQRGRN